MNPFETFLLNFGKAAIIAAPAALPLFVHSTKGVAIANVSEDFLMAFVQMAQPAQTPAVAAAPAPAPAPASALLAALKSAA